MKIWFPLIQAGSGTDVFTRRLALELKNVGINVSITLFDRRFEFFPQLLRNFTPPINTTVIHTNSWNGFAFRRPDCRLIVTRHLDVFDSKYLPYKSIKQRIYHNLVVQRFERQSFESADAISVVSNELASTTKTRTNKPLWTIPTWVNTNVFCPDLKSSQTGDRPFRLLFVGNPTARKGADLLKPIMDLLGNRFELVITSGLRSSNVSKFKLSNYTITKMITDDHSLAELYNSCDAVLFPSRLEGFSFVPLEAMACGKPIVASNTSSLPEAIIDRQTGLLCRLNDPESFAEACIYLADNPDISRDMGDAGRSHVINNFSENVIIPKYLSLYAGNSMSATTE